MADTPDDKEPQRSTHEPPDGPKPPTATPPAASNGDEAYREAVAAPRVELDTLAAAFRTRAEIATTERERTAATAAELESAASQRGNAGPPQHENTDAQAKGIPPEVAAEPGAEILKDAGPARRRMMPGQRSDARVDTDLSALIAKNPRPEEPAAQPNPAPTSEPESAIGNTPPKERDRESAGDNESAAPTQAPKRYTGRLGGLDIARALAIFGMFYAHVGPVREFTGAAALLDRLPDGRSSILFAILAGISLSILTGRNIPYSGQQMRTARLRIIGRSCVLLVIAGLLAMLGTPVAVILACYSAWFIAALPLTRWSSRRLLRTAAVLAFLAPVVLRLTIWIMENFHLWQGNTENGFIINVFVTGTYPGVVYMVYVITGMGIGRLDLTSQRIQARLVAAGTALMIVGYGSAWIVSQIFKEALSRAPVQGSWDPELEGVQPWLGLPFPDIHFWTGAEPHTETIFEVIGSGGFALALLGICLLSGRLARTVLYPLAAAGSMSLTAYSAHIVAIAFNPDWNQTESWFPILALVIGSLVLCTVWKQVSTRGPLEWLMWRMSVMASHTPEDEVPPAADADMAGGGGERVPAS